MTKEDILKVFPGLNSDNHFKITSPYDENYNCIAWAAIHTDYWLWPPGGRRLDGVLFYWPIGVPKDDRLSSFIKMYETYGYTLCETWDLEEGYRKITIYIKPDGITVTHASRQLRDGHWTSKLGKGNDIQHGNPYSIEGNFYGHVGAFMKKKLE